MTTDGQAEFADRCTAKLVGALLTYDRIRMSGELGPQDTYAVEFGAELLTA